MNSMATTLPSHVSVSSSAPSAPSEPPSPCGCPASRSLDRDAHREFRRWALLAGLDLLLEGSAGWQGEAKQDWVVKLLLPGFLPLPLSCGISAMTASAFLHHVLWWTLLEVRMAMARGLGGHSACGGRGGRSWSE